jgi:hypothetical protein
VRTTKASTGHQERSSGGLLLQNGLQIRLGPIGNGPTWFDGAPAKAGVQRRDGPNVLLAAPFHNVGDSPNQSAGTSTAGAVHEDGGVGLFRTVDEVIDDPSIVVKAGPAATVGFNVGRIGRGKRFDGKPSRVRKLWLLLRRAALSPTHLSSSRSSVWYQY